MELAVEVREGDDLRGTHPYHYRSGEWARVAMIQDVPDDSGRVLALVQFEDGQADWWALSDPDAGYEVRGH